MQKEEGLTTAIRTHSKKENTHQNPHTLTKNMPSHSPDGNSTTSHQSETAMSPPPPVREDYWTEDATFTLIKAWGDKFLQTNRGNLRQIHWQQVADAVNNRHSHNRRSDIQCKNRIDTLKKKYKLEKSKQLELGFHNYIPSWPFFAPLDSLIGPVFKPSVNTPTLPPQRKRFPALPPPPSLVPVGRRSKRQAPPLTDGSFFRRNFLVDGEADDVESDTDTVSWRSRKIRRLRVEEDGGDPYGQLADAIRRFAEAYERVEEAKQRQVVELEKQRMKFTKDLELQRMKLMMESHIQLEKLTRFKWNFESEFCRSVEGDHSGSIS